MKHFTRKHRKPKLRSENRIVKGNFSDRKARDKTNKDSAFLASKFHVTPSNNRFFGGFRAIPTVIRSGHDILRASVIYDFMQQPVSLLTGD